MSDYLRALKAVGWLNLNTDYRANNISGDYCECHKEKVGGRFGLSNYETKESIGILTGDDLVAFAKKEGWKDE
jgi:hypothetical protein